ncbi:hypothetical protein [Phyllobacterium sp. K27]
MTTRIAWFCAAVAVIAIATFIIINPLENRTTGQQPSPHALDQSGQ